MKKIINGTRYDTTKAIEIGSFSSPHNCTDFQYWEATLYRTKNGRFFLAGEGGAMSRYGTPVSGGMGYGERLEPMSREDALEWAERYLDADDAEKHFGDDIQDA